MPNPNVASFPYAASTDDTLTVATDNADTTLSADIGSSDTTIGVASTSSFDVPCLIVIDSEVILAMSTSGNNFTLCVRGFQGSTEATHSSGTSVFGYIMAYHHNQMAAEMKSVSSYLFDADLSGFKKSENLLTYSETFTNVYWFTSSGATVSLNGSATLVNGAPAYNLRDGTSLGLNMISANPNDLVIGQPFTFSVYALYNTNQWLAIGQNLNGAGSEPRLAYFDIQNGVLGNVGADANAAIVPVGGGWYRCMIVTNCTSNSYKAFDISLVQSNGGLTYLGTASELVTISGAQVQSGGLDGPMSYIKTNGELFSLIGSGDLILDEGDLT